MTIKNDSKTRFYPAFFGFSLNGDLSISKDSCNFIDDSFMESKTTTIILSNEEARQLYSELKSFELVNN